MCQAGCVWLAFLRLRAGWKQLLKPGPRKRERRGPRQAGGPISEACPALVRKRLCRTACALEAIADFAIALIAPKPVKPCDGGVFRAFYLLLI